ncbi:cell filamentation protein Fic [Arcobacter sp. FW59]|nr:cell filamentation protein Fic [Arcobacter sp. FW59]
MSYKPPYTISDKILNLVVDITILLSKVDVSFKNDVHLRKKNQIKTVVGTLAIEGNNLDIKQVTAILEGKKVVGTQKEIQEVKSAIDAYENIERFNPYKIDDLFKVHSLMMNQLLENVGKFRDIKVAVKGDDIVHIAPPPVQVPKLIKQLFEWLEKSVLNPLIISSIFHYEFEFIHPFEDGNGRMGRFWQTLILSKYNPIFLSFPIESIIKQRQDEYYKTLSICDKEANSTLFIEFMLECIYEAISSEINSDKSSEMDIVSTDEAILEFLKANPKATIKILASKLNLTTRAIEKQLANLKKENKLQRIGSPKKGEWIVINNRNLFKERIENE